MTIRTVTKGALVLLATAGMAAAQDWRTPLKDGFEGTDFAPEGGLYYKDNFEQSAGQVTFQSEVTLHGNGALRLGVTPICPAGDEDCSERAEIWELPELRAPYDAPIWFGFAVKFAEPIPQEDHRHLIAQWKREIGPEAPGDYSPFLALRMRKGQLFATVETTYTEGVTRVSPRTGPACPDGETPVWVRAGFKQMRGLVAADSTWDMNRDGERFSDCTPDIALQPGSVSLPRPESGWIDFAILSLPGPHGDGHIEIYANGASVVAVKGHIGHDDIGLGENQYFKFGPYRSGASTDWALYYDDFRRSPQCRDVLDDAAACDRIN